MLRLAVLMVFVFALLAYVYLIAWLAIAPASILYSKPPEPQAPFAYYLRLMWKHELALAMIGATVVAYAVSLFRHRRDWRPFAVLVIGVPVAVGIFDVFGL